MADLGFYVTRARHIFYLEIFIKGRMTSTLNLLFGIIFAAKLHENEKNGNVDYGLFCLLIFRGRGGARRRGEKGTARQTLNSGGSRLSQKSSPTTKMGVKSYYLANYFSKTAWK